MTPKVRKDLEADMRRLASGDRSAFSPVYRALEPVVRRFAERLVGPEEAEDAVQESLLRLFRQAADFDERKDPVAWAVALTYWECRTVRAKRRRRRETAAEDLPAPTFDGDPESLAMEKQLFEHARAALDALTERDRESLREALEGSGPSPASLRKRKQRALERLRTMWRLNHG